ncbi:MAG: hypothetical protein CR988_06880 [Treponema sp.]|nr:MAG: hypothetical protein CR988_06880 [Treponema sp.]
MIIKPEGMERYALNRFDLLGNDETALSKAFAYVLSKNPVFLFKFLRFIGLNVKNTPFNFKSVSIQTERKRKEGRTDIELFCSNKFHVIIECKLGNNKIKRQRQQYLSSFADVPEKVLCILTQTNDYEIQISNEINIKNIGWIDIDNLIDDKTFELDGCLLQDFQNYLRRGYNLRGQKEILIQDLGDSKEVKKYKDHNIYRRDKLYGSPLYFAPYYTKASGETEGISSLSKILGIISAKPSEIPSFLDDLKQFAGEKTGLVKKWLEGVQLDKKEEIYTYFFLDDCVKIQTPLLKDRSRKKGRGKNWIAAQIPQNRCVTFEEFIRRIQEAH